MYFHIFGLNKQIKRVCVRESEGEIKEKINLHTHISSHLKANMLDSLY